MATANELCCEWAGCGARLPSADLLCQHVEDDHIARCEGVRVGRVGIVTRTGNNSMYPKIYSSLEGTMKLRFAVPLEMCFIISSKDHKIIKMHIIIYISQVVTVYCMCVWLLGYHCGATGLLRGGGALWSAGGGGVSVGVASQHVTSYCCTSRNTTVEGGKRR